MLMVKSGNYVVSIGLSSAPIDFISRRLYHGGQRSLGRKMCCLPWRNRRFVLNRGLPETEVVKCQNRVTAAFPEVPVEYPDRSTIRDLRLYPLVVLFGSLR